MESFHQKELNVDLDQALAHLQARIADRYGKTVSCEQIEWGMSGGGGFVVDHGKEAKITALQFRTDGVYAKIMHETSYIVVEFKTKAYKEVDAFVRTLLPCDAPKTKWPPSELELKARRLKKDLRFVGFIIGLALRAPIAKIFDRKRST